MSALPLKADIAECCWNVRFGPLADIPPIHSMTSSALASSEAGIVTPNAFVALRLMTSTAQVVVDGNGLRQQLAMGQQQKQRVPATN
jgi:hypothetical protein